MEVKIRPLQEEDAHTSYKWRNLPEVWTYTAFEPTGNITLEDELQWIRKVIGDDTSRRFAILADGNYVGNVYLTSIKGGEAEYSIFIGDKDYWGKGVGRQASAQIINYAKNELKLKSVILGVNENNAAAVRLYTSMGFKAYDKDDKFTWMRLDLSQWQTEG